MSKHTAPSLEDHFNANVLGKMYIWHTSFEDHYQTDYLGKNARDGRAPGGEIREWCLAHGIPMISDPYGQGFYLDPQDDVQRMAMKLRWS